MTQETYNYYIFEKQPPDYIQLQLEKVLKDQESDTNLFGFMLSHQGQSIHYALNYTHDIYFTSSVDAHKVVYNYKNNTIVKDNLIKGIVSN